MIGRTAQTLAKHGKEQLRAQRHRYRSSSDRYQYEMTAFLVGGIAYLMYEDRFHSKGTSFELPTTFADPARAEFRLHAALEFKEEMQKIKLARFLHELTELAKAQAPKSDDGKLKRYNTEWLSQHDHGTIDLRGIDLRRLRTGQAMYIVQKILEGGKLNVKAVVQICQSAAKLLEQEPTLLEKKGIETVTVIGDLHGSIQSLKKIFELLGDFRGDTNHIVVFDGDFVDRGEDSLDVLLILLLLKIAVPNKVYLIRGNHEDSMIAKVYGYADELKQKYFLNDQELNKVWDSMSAMFSSLPLGVVTDTAFIVHGGLPSKDFRLDQLRRISAEDRGKCHTLVYPKTKLETLIQYLLWSDPSRKKGIHPSPRGTGVKFGRDIANTFLERENLKYIVRGHEPVEEGIKDLDCGDDRHVITVFSAANYPNEEGQNEGGYIDLNKDGSYTRYTYNYKIQRPENVIDSFNGFWGTIGNALGSLFTKNPSTSSSTSNVELPPQDKLRMYITNKKSDLVKGFAAVENAQGLVTIDQWVSVIKATLDLRVINWKELQPQIIPTVDPKGELINWREYIIEYTTDIKDLLADKEKMGRTVDWMDKMMIIFEFLDIDMDGTVGLPEFIAGTRILNRYHLPKLRQISDPVELYSRFEHNPDGKIGLDEFKEQLEHSHMVVKMAKSVGRQQVKSVAKNMDLLTTAFSFLDKNGTGTITFEEWKQCIDLLNKQLHKSEKVYDAEELFKMMDIDGTGEIDLEEFEQLFGSL